jgi:hypothetical protein
MECKRRDLAVLATCAIVFFLYFNIHLLHPKNYLSKLAASAHAAYEHGAANSTLGVSNAPEKRSNCQVAWAEAAASWDTR